MFENIRFYIDVINVCVFRRGFNYENVINVDVFSELLNNAKNVVGGVAQWSGCRSLTVNRFSSRCARSMVDG